MAYTSVIPVRRLDRAVKYVMNKEKTTAVSLQDNRSIVHDDSHGLRQNVQPVDVCSHCADPAVHIRR